MTRNPRVALFLLAAVAGILAIIGAVGDWATLGDEAAKGTDANAGKSTLICAISAVVLAAVAVRWRWVGLLAAIPAAIAAAISCYYAVDPNEFVEGASGLDRGWGLILAPLGSVALFVFCLAMVFLSRDEPAAPAAPAPPAAGEPPAAAGTPPAGTPPEAPPPSAPPPPQP